MTFFVLGHLTLSDSYTLMQVFEQTCTEIGVPLAGEKTEGPVQILIFLGLEINTLEMSVKVPQAKLIEFKGTLESLYGRKKSRVKEIQSLTDLLNFCSLAIPSSRGFSRRFYYAISSMSNPRHHIRLNQELKEDIRVWLVFLDCFNGVTYIPNLEWSSNTKFQLFTDSARVAILGQGLISKDIGCTWMGTSVLRDITFLELVLVALAFHIWGTSMVNHIIPLHIDNSALVLTRNQQGLSE
ncbi:uncharacterized protein LOC132547301 [Ylistrum balloti]|uniref:uncharacterized protein LOC132547301 n=1 Tax=Ylistrum balloti TaxID=509963 RepID=UPI002905DDF3|nr:uncharacterized protein LOC132547301 [Ylistrum balloti]